MLLESRAGIKMLHVPYKGNAQMNLDLMAERLDINLLGFPSVETLVKAGKMRLLAVGGDRRDPVNSDVPTVAEAGFPGFWVGTWFAIATRAGTPRPIILRLNREVNRSLKSAEVQKPLLEAGYELANGTPEDLGKLIREQIPLWTKIARQAGIQFD